MTSLNDYLKETEKWLRDTRQGLINPQNLINYVNRGRREVAMRTQCLRVLTQSSAPCVTASVITAGTGYTSATVTITPPDFPSGQLPFPGGAQATATAILQSGSLAAVDINFGGSGYFQPIATVTGPGTGASVTIQTGPINTLNPLQEQYFFKDIYLGNNPGIESVIAIRNVSVLYANYRYSLPMYSWSQYQSQIRQFPFQFSYVPTFVSQFGRGASGSLFFYPLPSQTYQYELDCYCLPQDLLTDNSYEAIPDPWTDAISYFAASLAFQELQNMNYAKMYLDLFDRELGIYSRASQPGRVINPYGRY